jgi:hypothetical protein
MRLAHGQLWPRLQALTHLCSYVRFSQVIIIQSEGQSFGIHGPSAREAAEVAE